VSNAASDPESLLVVRLGAMGDIIHTLPAVMALRDASPDVRIGWIVEERWAELLCAQNSPRSGPRSPSRPLVDLVHAVNTKAWRKSLLSSQTRKQISLALHEVRDLRYEIAVDFQGALKSAIIARSSAAQTVVGLDHPRETPARIFYSRRVTTEKTHVIEQYHSLAEGVAGKTLPVPGVNLPHDDQAEADITKRLSGLDGEKAFVIITPGTGWGAKRWPPERYGKVASALAEDGLTPFINCGPGEEDLAHAVQAASNGKSHLISCSIAELIALTRRARLFIGGDTGPLHLAAALQVPVVAIFGPTDPARNGPYGTKNVVLRNPASPTSLSHTSAPDPGLLQITADEVISAARRLLGSTHA
jgi:lipopolysaccharide heptosyltransferase I